MESEEMRKIEARSKSVEPSEPENVDKRLYVGGVFRALRVLHAFRDQQVPLSLTQLADRTGLGISAAQRHVYTLTQLGYLRQVASSKRYVLTPKVMDFANAYLRNDPLVGHAFPYLQEASKRTGETVNLTRLDRTDVIFLSRFPSSSQISADLVIGSRLPTFCTSPGRAILAHLDPEDADAILSQSDLSPWTAHTLTDRDTIRARFQGIRDRGYETAFEECFLSDLSVAAPIFGREGRVMAAVNIAVAKPRWSEENFVESLAPIVVETARAISATALEF